MSFRWSNVPIPEAPLAGIALGSILQWAFSGKILALAWVGHALGWPLVVAGGALVVWSVREAGQVEISAPDRLLTGGPYAFSRNPMYVGWLSIYLGIAFVANTIWILALVPLVVAYIHLVDTRREETTLEEQFGDRYREYRRRVRRYL